MCKGLISWRHRIPGFLETNCNRRYWVCLYFDCRLFFLIFFILVVKLITNGKISWLLSLYCFSPRKFRRLLLVWIGCLTFQRLKSGSGVFLVRASKELQVRISKLLSLKVLMAFFSPQGRRAQFCQLSCRRCSNFVSTLFERFHSSISMFFSNYS